MKVKAAVSTLLPKEAINALNDPFLAKRIYEEVLRTHLRVSEMGPAEFYIQNCDMTITVPGFGLGCEVRLTGVSRNRVRSEQDFFNALSKLESIYRETLENALSEDFRVQLFVVLMLDSPIQNLAGKETTVLETDPFWVQGNKNTSGGHEILDKFKPDDPSDDIPF